MSILILLAKLFIQNNRKVEFSKLILAIFFLSCTNGTRDRKEDEVLKEDTITTNHGVLLNDFYQDINLGKLEGIRKLSQVVYPCIEIKKTTDGKSITYHFGKDEKTVREYRKINDYWISEYSYQGDTSMIYTYEFILPERLIVFSYSNKSEFVLLDAEVSSGFRDTIYISKKGISLEPKIENIDKVKDHLSSTYIRDFKKNNSALIETTLNIRENGDTSFHYIHCFEPINRSFEWLTLFGPKYLKEIKCK